MYRREAGYDADNGNWFWAKYTPYGEVEQDNDGVYLAGRVAKGATKECIACHKSAPGNHTAFNTDRHR